VLAWQRPAKNSAPFQKPAATSTVIVWSAAESASPNQTASSGCQEVSKVVTVAVA